MNRHFSHDEIVHLARNNLDHNAREHLQECAQCHHEYQQMLELFRQMKTELSVAPERDLWSGIAERRQRSLRRQKYKRRNMFSLAIAASLMMIIGAQWFSLNQNQAQQLQIQALMHQSQQLETQLSSSQLNLVNSKLYFVEFRQQLFAIDDELQRAYQNKAEFSHIQSLWEQRVSLLQKMVRFKHNPQKIESI
ncbi:DUF3379 family protein [Pleionea sp. CnH1-48]|uniref:DUF3379 family protein n=1 Tax=Pleionea sp. CnH1-48 TaxID=2954494 RepID=UPI0020973545|nr:DUF3379 family protein [Pleionea sp. CnH1-48]MCO7224836.1 hypothetical protein [Pleionea sp. CnH1-48]